MPSTGELKITELYHLTVLGAGSQNQGVGRVGSSEGCKEESVSCLSPSFWWFAGLLYYVLTHRCIIPISAFIPI